MGAVSSAVVANTRPGFISEKARAILASFLPLALFLFLAPWVLDCMPAVADYQFVQQVFFIAPNADASQYGWVSGVLLLVPIAYLAVRFARTCAPLFGAKAQRAIDLLPVRIVEQVLRWAGVLVLGVGITFHAACRSMLALMEAIHATAQHDSALVNITNYSTTGAMVILAVLFSLIALLIAIWRIRKNVSADGIHFSKRHPVASWLLLVASMVLLPPFFGLVAVGICTVLNIVLLLVMGLALKVMIIAGFVIIAMVLLPIFLKALK